MLYGGDGDDLLRGGKGSDTFVYSQGQDTVMDFENADILAFSSIEFFGSDVDDILSAASVTETGVLFDFGADNQLFLQNQSSIAELAGDIIFV